MKRNRMIALLLCVLSAILLTACSNRSAEPQSDASAAQIPFPQFEGTDLEGGGASSRLFANNAFTVVNFWFNGCKPCIEELADLDALNERVRAQGGELIGINIETLDGDAQGIEAARALLAAKGAKYRNIYFDSASEAGRFARGILAFPTTYVVDRSGGIVGDALAGSIRNASVRDAVQSTIDAAIAADAGK